jgi:hypothetical protein
MSHNDHPTLALPGGTKMETLLVCVDGKCGRCVRCDYFQKSKTLVARGLATDLAYEQLRASVDRGFKEHQALILVLKGAMETIAASISNKAAKAQLQQLIDTTPEEALKSLEARGLNGEDGEVPPSPTTSSTGAHE